MNEQEDRRVRLSCAIDVELLKLARPVGQTQRLAEPRACRVADARDALLDLIAHRRVKPLIVGGIELDLIHVHPYQRAFLVRRWAQLAGDRIRRLRACDICDGRGGHATEEAR